MVETLATEAAPSHRIAQTATDDFNDRMHHLADSYVSFCVDLVGDQIILLAKRHYPEVPLHQIRLQHVHSPCFGLRTSRGSWLLDDFCDALPDATQEEREALRGFRKVRPSIVYEVQYCTGRAIRVLDLENHNYLTVRTRPVQALVEAQQHLEPKALLVISVVPLRDFHTHIGPLRVIRREERARLEALEARELS